MHVATEEYQGELIFLHKVKDGAVDDSYGIQVAKLANLPDSVINRAQVILNNFEQKDETQINSTILSEPDKEDSFVAEEQATNSNNTNETNSSIETEKSSNTKTITSSNKLVLTYSNLTKKLVKLRNKLKILIYQI